jgi:hypothetical protein
MIRLRSASACILAALFATGLSAQTDSPRCPDGESDDEAISIDVTVAAHPTRVARTLDSLLVTTGYVIQDAPQGAGRWSIAPRFTWTDELKETEFARGPHPGVQMFVTSEVAGDSTRVEVGARVVCRAGTEELAVEMMAAATLANDFASSLDSLRALGVDLSAPVERKQSGIQIPDSVARFAFAGREDFDDPRLGSSVRYAREEDGMYFDVYVYPGPPADSSCPRECVESWVEKEAQGFIDSGPEFLRRGYFRRMDVKRNEAVPVPAGAAYRAGRHVVMEVVRGEGPATPMESQYILYSFPDYMVKVRATYAPSTKMEGTVRTFVAELLEALAPR